MINDELSVPHNSEAEQSVLGAILISAECIEGVAAFLEPKHFFHDNNAEIYRAMLALRERGRAIDYLTLDDELKNAGTYDKVGGIFYLGSLLEAVPTSVNVIDYARIVEGHATQRNLISTASKIAQLGYTGLDPSAALAMAEKMIQDIQATQHGQDSLVQFDTAIGNVLDSLEHLQEGNVKLGISTGFAALDNLLGGLRPSEMIILGARPSMGKSALALNLALNAAIRECAPTLFVSVEMPADALARRALSEYGRIDQNYIQNGPLDKSQATRMARAVSALGGAPLWVDERPNITLAGIRQRCMEMDRETGIGLLVVDYLQLMVTGKGTRNEEVGNISSGLKSIAREFNIPVLVLSQLNRTVESQKPPIPTMSHLRDSGSIEQDADVIMFIYREDWYNPDTERWGLADIIVAKHRNGPTGKATLFFDKALVTFRDLEPNRESLEGI